MSLMILAILAAVMVTSALSGVLGMGGGLILMGVLALVLPVGQAMVLHGIAQLAANGSRAVLHRQHIAWRVLPGYLVGAVASLALFSVLAVMTEKWIVYLGLGALPFLALKVKALHGLSIERRSHAALCGAAVTVLQLLAGASGPILDIFFLRTSMSRHEIVATKALTQCFGHSAKLFYYGGLMAMTATSEEIPWWLPVATAVLALGGTLIGARVLDRLSDQGFQKLSQRMVLAIGALYLVKGVSGLAGY